MAELDDTWEVDDLIDQAKLVSEAGRLPLDVHDLALQASKPDLALSGPAQRFIGATLERLSTDMLEIINQLKNEEKAA